MKTYNHIKQDLQRDLDNMYPDTLLLTLQDVSKLYGFKNPQKAKLSLSLPRVKVGGRVKYYKGDIAADIAKKMVENGR